MPTFSMRLSKEDHERLSTIAELEDKPVADLVREAIAEWCMDYARSENIDGRLAEAEKRRAATIRRLRELALTEQPKTSQRVVGSGAQS